jgi:hypothetical protein
MAKNSVTDWDTTAANNTDVGGISIAEGMAPGNVNNAMREMMAQIAAIISGSTAFNTLVAGFARIQSAAASRLDLQATSVADTHERTRLVRDTTAFRHQTANSGATVAVDDYVAAIGASGATSHTWKVEDVVRFAFDGSSYTFGSPSQARAALAAMPLVISGAGAGQILALDAANGASLSLPGSGSQTYAYWYIPQTISGGSLGTSQVGVAAGATLLNSGTAGIILRGFCIRLT